MLEVERQVWANQMLRTMRREFPRGCTVEDLVDLLDLADEDVVDLAGVLLERGAVKLVVA